MPDHSGSGRLEFRNQILAALETQDINRLRPYLARVPLVLSQVLHEVGTPVDAVYFLEEGLVSLIANTGDGGQVEVGMSGRDGLIGVAALLRPHATALHRTVVQVAGSAYRMQATRLYEASCLSSALRDHCLRYVEFMLVQAAQSAACNARHGIEARLARWLLMTRARVGSDDLPMTQDFLSYMLGVRRAGVSVVAGMLASKGLIQQSRGRLVLLDIAGLEREACSCYRFVEESRTQVGLPILATAA